MAVVGKMSIIFAALVLFLVSAATPSQAVPLFPMKTLARITQGGANPSLMLLLE